MLSLSEFKWVGLAAGFLAYTALTWNVATTYNEGSWVEKELAQTKQVLVEKEKNAELARQLVVALHEKNALQKKIAEESWRTIFDEVAISPVYNTCLVTDRVRDAIQRQLDSQ